MAMDIFGAVKNFDHLTGSYVSRETLLASFKSVSRGTMSSFCLAAKRQQKIN
ncbi:MAG: hypothetical protein RLZZ488_222 [Pseudomonadota bacterium]|jgi:hypothetical protein